MGDRIIAVNRIDIAGMSHGDVVNLIKESGLHVRLTIGCPQEGGGFVGNLVINTQQASPGQHSQANSGYNTNIQITPNAQGNFYESTSVGSGGAASNGASVPVTNGNIQIPQL